MEINSRATARRIGPSTPALYSMVVFKRLWPLLFAFVPRPLLATLFGEINLLSRSMNLDIYFHQEPQQLLLFFKKVCPTDNAIIFRRHVVLPFSSSTHHLLFLLFPILNC